MEIDMKNYINKFYFLNLMFDLIFFFNEFDFN